MAALVLDGRRSAADGPASDPVMLVMPADHVIEDVAAFQSAVRTGSQLAATGCLVTFGIVPTGPRTGYGYIKKGSPYVNGGTDPGPFHTGAFVEKPDSAAAAEMVRSGEYLWNSGAFMMRASVWNEQIRLHRRDIAEACDAAYSQGGSDGDFFRPETGRFTNCPSESIDYAVMEKAAGDGRQRRVPECVVLPLDAGWSDIGAWSAIWEQGRRDSNGNVIQGDVYAQGMRGSLLVGQHRMLAAVGLDDVIVIETADAVLVAHKDHVQDVKELVERLKADKRTEQEDHRKVHRPWGNYEIVDSGERFQVKRLTVNPGASLSLQVHSHRAEHWVVVKGTARVTKDGSTFTLNENESAYVPIGAEHRLENPGDIPLEIVEVQSGDYLGEDDIVRLDDRYNRHLDHHK
jgi:mannose-1-phosphate guanylyltransferase/mannose-6-phosphate isomerase